MCVCVCVRTCVHVCVLIHMCVLMCIYVCMCMCLYVSMWNLHGVCVCMCVCVCVGVCVSSMHDTSLYDNFTVNIGSVCIKSTTTIHSMATRTAPQTLSLHLVPLTSLNVSTIAVTSSHKASSIDFITMVYF